MEVRAPVITGISLDGGVKMVAAEIPGRDLRAKSLCRSLEAEEICCRRLKNAMTWDRAHDLPKMNDSLEKTEVKSLLRMLLK